MMSTDISTAGTCTSSTEKYAPNTTNIFELNYHTAFSGLDHERQQPK